MALRFSPRWYWVLLTMAAVPLFVSLGFWQWHRGQYHQAQWDAFRNASTQPPAEMNAADLAHESRYTRVRIDGQYDADHQFLLDNISHDGAPGYEVLTVFALAGGSHLLVDRGWVPFSGYRETLPDVSFDPAAAPPRLTGRLSVLPVPGIAAGQLPPAADGPWPRLASFPTVAQLAQAYGAPLLPVLLLLDTDAGPGYVREWQPPGISPDRNFSYAVQWWSFAVLAVGLLIGLNLKRSNA